VVVTSLKYFKKVIARVNGGVVQGLRSRRQLLINSLVRLGEEEAGLKNQQPQIPPPSMNKPVERKKVLVVMAGFLMSVMTSHQAWSQGEAGGGELPQYREKAEVEVTLGGKKEKLKANRLGMYG
jgi:hypothetical protein